MTHTININKARAAHNSNKKKVLAAAGATALGGGIAAAALSAEPMDDELGQPEEIIEDEIRDAVTPVPADSQAVSSPVHRSGNAVHTGTTQPPRVPDSVAGNETIAELPETGDDAILVEEDVTAMNDEVSPGQVADAIIAEDQIDPNDIEEDDVMEVDEVLTNIDVEGQTVNVAAVHLRDDNEQFFLVDIDNDRVFDVAVDQGGNLGNIPVPITVDDAEHSIASKGGYFASNTSIPDDSDIEDSIAGDMIS